MNCVLPNSLCIIKNTLSPVNVMFLLLAAPFHKLLEAHLGFAFRMGSDVRDCFIDSTQPFKDET
jgi:hypothetical protein